MIIQATSHGTAAAEEPFAFTYSGDFTDNRVDGVGTVRLNTSGTLTVTGKAVTVSVTIVGAGGGGVQRKTSVSSFDRAAGGGSGGMQTITITLEPGTYEIVIGTGGLGYYTTGFSDVGVAAAGGSTFAFDNASTGGGGASIVNTQSTSGVTTPGTGGTPNGNAGTTTAGGAPNGGSPSGGSAAANSGGDGYVEITFS